MACTVRRGELLFLCHWLTLRTMETMNIPEISTNISEKMISNPSPKKLLNKEGPSCTVSFFSFIIAHPGFFRKRDRIRKSGALERI